MDSARLSRRPVLAARGSARRAVARAAGRTSAPTSARIFARASALALWLVFSAAACGDGRDPLVLAATTSTYDSGLLERLISSFETEHPEIVVRTIVVGSGEALELGRRGDADVLLVHAPEAETRFIEAGYASDRTPVMYNDFLIVGPPEDPDHIASSDSPGQALARIAAAEAPFVSRGDSSGTHARELAMWREAGLEPEGDWYLETGQGQGESLQIASERSAYMLTDRATFMALRRIIDLEPVLEGHESLLNLYSVIVPTAARQTQAANAFADWVTSGAGRGVIAEFRLRPRQDPLFHPLTLGESLPFGGRHDLEADPVSPPDSLRGPTS